MGCGHAKYTPFDSFHVPSHVLEMVEGMCSYLRPLNQNERISLGVDTHSSITTYLERNDLHLHSMGLHPMDQDSQGRKKIEGKGKPTHIRQADMIFGYRRATNNGKQMAYARLEAAA